MIGNLICDRYRVIQVLNQGIFCRTYIAHDISITDYPTYVVKHFLPSDKIALPIKTRRRLFTREVGALMKLDNYEYVPHLLNHFEENQEFYLVQQFINGHSLSAELYPGKRWSETKVIKLLQEVLNILIFVHAQGLIHRDVKPSNIMRRKRDNRLVLIDFGAVKPMWNELLINQTSIDNTTVAIGTPGYMPYEQHQGKPVPNSDIYALGVIGIQALTGIHPVQLPKDPDTGEIVWQHLVRIDKRLALVVNKMVSYHSQNRYKSAIAALAALMQSSKINNINNIASSKNKYSSILEAVELAPELNKFSLKSRKLLAPSKKYFSSLKWNKKIKIALKNRTKFSTVPGKYGLLIGLIIGIFSSFLLMFISYLSIQKIDSIKLQNTQIKNPSTVR